MAHRERQPVRTDAAGTDSALERRPRRGSPRRLAGSSRRLKGTLAAGVLLAAAAAPVAIGATPAAQKPHQRVDLKVLLLTSNSAANPYSTWQDALTREGVPFDAKPVTTILNDAAVADYAANRAKYQAVILDAPTSDGNMTVLKKLETTFGVRQFTDRAVPGAPIGMNNPAQTGSPDGQTGTLTATGKLAFPYLKGDVPIPNADPAVDETFGSRATPLNTTDFTSLVDGPAGSSYVGVYTHPEDGREELVSTVSSNATQSHNQLLRHGIINWVTRGVFLGFQRNYLELQVDDLFLGDDSWDPATHTTDYDPDKAIRMDAEDVSKAVDWSKQTGLRIDMAYNGAGSDAYKDSNGGADPLLDAMKANKAAFGWINHTFEHPNMDCSSPRPRCA